MNPETELSTADLAHAQAEREQRERVPAVADDRTKADRRDAVQPGAPVNTDDAAPLFAAGEAQKLRADWDAVQAAFVDEPRRSVERADVLVAGAMRRLAEIFADERQNLEHQWDRGEEISTEDLRIALQRYRSFFTRLLRV